MALFHDSAIAGASGNQGGGVGYQISRSLRFNSSDNAYLSRAFSATGNQKTATFAFWLKRTTLGTNQYFYDSTSTNTSIYFGSDDKLAGNLRGTGGTNYTWTTNAVFRDVSAWYHIVVALDSSQATAANRVKVYVNGTEQTFSSVSYCPQDTLLFTNDTRYIGQEDGAFGPFNGYLADIHFIDGQALTPSSFTEVSATTGQLIPKAYTGSFGTNGFWLKFSDNSAATATTLGKDYSGNNNNWSPSNLSVTAGAGNDSLVDTPTSYGTDTGAGGEVRGNYATLNPLFYDGTLSNGNLEILTSIASYSTTKATIGMSSGKWYCEFVQTSSNVARLGISLGSALKSDFLGINTLSWAYIGSGQKIYNGSSVSYGATWGINDVIGVAFDADVGSLYFYKNGAIQGGGTPAFTGLTNGPYFFALSDNSTAQQVAIVANFGQRPFAYTAPSGFKALCDTNLPAPVVAKPNTVMDVKLYTGNNSTQAISGLGFSPDLVWIKQRDVARDHRLLDIVRGTNKYLASNLMDAEGTFAYLSSFDSNGFTLTSGDQATNGSGNSYVTWTWDAGSSTVTNTQGSITSQVRANASAGFSIVTWTGNGTTATIGHGGLVNLDKGLIIVKSRSTTASWMVGHGALGWTQGFEGLNTTSAANTASSYWNNTAPTSTVFTVSGADANMNGNGRSQLAYCFSPVAGYSSFGSYTGNGSTDGPFVYTGFRPAFVLVKGTANGLIWTIEDNKRDTYNGTSKYLQPQSSNAEGSVAAPHYDFTSNGFKIRTTDSAWNQSSNTYIYFAVAESPFAYSRAR